MRSCAYCGRELKDGEKCDCPQSMARRQRSGDGADFKNEEKNSDKKVKKETKRAQKEAKKEKNGTQNAYGAYSHGADRTEYRTGYTDKESRVKHAWEKRRYKRAAYGGQSIRLFLKDFILSPVDKIANPGHISRMAMMIISAVQGAVLWLGMFFIVTGVSRSPFNLLATLLSFNGVAGYKNILGMFLWMIMGAVSGVILFFMYTAIFYFINRFIFRLNTPYWSFCERLSLTGIPFTIITAIGVILGMISSTTLLIMILCGAVSTLILTYEALKNEWLSKSPGKVMYAMMLGMFVFLSFICYLIRISVYINY